MSKPLKLKIGESVPHLERTVNNMHRMTKVFGIPMSIDKLNKLTEEKEKEKKLCEDFIKEKFENKFGCPVGYIDYTGRKVSNIHIATLLCKYLGIEHNKYINKNYNISFKLSDMDELLTDNNLSEEELEVVRKIKEASKCRTILGNSKQLTTCYYDYRYKLRQTSKEKFGREMTDEEINTYLTSPDIFYVYPEFQMLRTGRISTKNPNMQGLQKELKECITAPKGYKIASMDIKGQEVHILICGILENEKLKQNYYLSQDPYKAIIETLGYEYSDNLKGDVKIVILGIMNGMSKGRALSEVKHENMELARKVYDMITGDPGYVKKVETYVSQNKSSANPMIKGLFGTELVPDTENLRYKNSLENKLKNGFFQVTASEIVSLCTDSFHKDINELPNITLSDIRLLLPIYDEFVIIYREDLEDIALDLFEKNFRPLVCGWSRMMGKVNVGKTYISK